MITDTEDIDLYDEYTIILPLIYIYKSYDEKENPPLGQPKGPHEALRGLRTLTFY